MGIFGSKKKKSLEQPTKTTDEILLNELPGKNAEPQCNSAEPLSLHKHDVESDMPDTLDTEENGMPYENMELKESAALNDAETVHQIGTKSNTGFFSKLKEGLKKTGGLLDTAFSGRSDRVNDEFFDSLEEAMIMADMGMDTTETLLDSLRDSVKEQGIKTIPEAREALIGIMADAMRAEVPFALDENKKAVLLIVGVNGVGKTTSIGKLAHYYKEQGRTAVIAAADTFRAAAAQQLEEWARRSDTHLIKHGEGADPAAVVYDAMASYKAKGYDLLICDTAGRLHNKKNLMDELAKIRRVISRDLPNTAVETLLVLDATTGQNAVLQAKVFAQAADITGLILTKLDGTAKGGVALSIKHILNLPIRFIGVGESIDDMHPFDSNDFSRALLG